jgi:hypothetical protein
MRLPGTRLLRPRRPTGTTPHLANNPVPGGTGSPAGPVGKASTGLLGVAAAGLEVQPRKVRVGDGWAATLAVVGYPAQVGAGWLDPLTAWPGRLDVTVHIDPVPAPVAAARLRRQLARLESTRRITAGRGELADPGLDAAVADAEDMAGELARGEGRLFQAGLYLTVHADTEGDLDADVAAVRGIAASLLLDCVPVSWRALQGWITTLPFGVDLLGIGRTLDTAALAAGFPFTAPDLPAADPATPGAAPTGILYGLNAATGGLVVWDRWTADNHNTVILARSGAGKSYLAKLDLLRNLHTGVHAAVIDPEDEYGRLADAVGGSTIRLGAPGVRLNPLDLTTVGAGSAGAARFAGGRRSDELTRRALFCHTLISVLLGTDLGPAGRAALDRAIIAAYAAAGITSDQRTWRRRPPLLADVTTALANDRDPAGPELAARLEPFVTGSWAGLFDGPTTTLDPAEHLVVWSLRELPDELKAAGTLLALDRIWTSITTSGTGSSARGGAGRRRRLVVVDEAWTLMQSEHGARFLFRMAKASRKHWAGLTVITQDPADLLGTDLGQAVVANAATQILLRHAPQAAPAVAKAFNLTAGERAWLTAAPRGHGLLLGGGAGDRVVFEALASSEEDRLITTDPTHLDDPTDPAANDLDASLDADLGGDGVGDALDGEDAFDDGSYDDELNQPG